MHPPDMSTRLGFCKVPLLSPPAQWALQKAGLFGNHDGQAVIIFGLEGSIGVLSERDRSGGMPG